MKILYRGKNMIDAGLLYGAFTTSGKASAYAALVATRDGIPMSEIKHVDLDVDPEFHAAPTEVIDNRSMPG